MRRLTKKWYRYRTEQFLKHVKDGQPGLIALMFADEDAVYAQQIDKVRRSKKEANKQVCNWYFSHADLIGRKPSLDKWPESIYFNS